MPLHALVPIIQDNDSFKAKQKSPAIRARDTLRGHRTQPVSPRPPRPPRPLALHIGGEPERGKSKKVHTNHKTLNAHGHTYTPRRSLVMSLV